MSMNCRDCESQLTPFVDGELTEATAASLAAHLAACPDCRCRAQLERMGRRLVRERAPRLAAVAPASLRSSVRRLAPPPRRRVRPLWVAAGAAAIIVVGVGLVGVAGVIRPIPVFAAQATLDHLKCMRLGPTTTTSDARACEVSWRAWQGWELDVPTGQQGAGLRLLGYRRCVVTEGRIAHLLYDWHGEIVSLFVLPDGPKVGHAELEMFGQDAVLWTSHDHTYALVGRGDRAAMAAMASSLEQELAAGPRRAGSGL